MPVLHLIAGPHGVGKTSLYHYLVAPRYPALPFIDMQGHAAAHLQHLADPAARAAAARDWADAQWQELLRARTSFVTETGFSHPSRVALVGQARALGFEVVLYAVGLDEPRKLLARVNQRVREGGDAVPSHKLLARYARTLDNLRHAVFMADLAMLIDGCDVHEGGPRLVATVMSGQMQLHTVQRPRWAERVLGFAEG
jgi:predicted ABC-type ATPase